ncbi:hypothetical protein FGO68_gene4446 [Halteria grandinella]|uniref:Uncharacterized protein n=1 Tax=Halteria grandinella TaxID=5974 RepID=A0A8J8NRR4_HALGN|nr:hypothetical protein FGO68_gene4446 [Halteria grandinella]
MVLQKGVGRALVQYIIYLQQSIIHYIVMSTREDYPPDTKLVKIEDAQNRQSIAAQIQAINEQSKQPQANTKHIEEPDNAKLFEELKLPVRPREETGTEESTDKRKCQNFPQTYLPAQNDNLRHMPFPTDVGAQIEPSILRSNQNPLPTPALKQRNPPETQHTKRMDNKVAPKLESKEPKIKKQANIARQFQILAERKYMAPSLLKIQKKSAEFLSYKKRYPLRSVIRLIRKVLKELLKARQLLESYKFPSERQSHYFRILAASPHRHLEETNWLFDQSKIWEVTLTELKSRKDEINKDDTLSFFFASQLCRDILFLAEFLIACRNILPGVRNRQDLTKPEKHRKYREENLDIDVEMIKELKQIAAYLHPTYANAL